MTTHPISDPRKASNLPHAGKEADSRKVANRLTCLGKRVSEHEKIQTFRNDRPGPELASQRRGGLVGDGEADRRSGATASPPFTGTVVDDSRATPVPVPVYAIQQHAASATPPAAEAPPWTGENRPDRG